MVTIVDFRKLKSDIIDVMITEGLLANCKISLTKTINSMPHVL
jgi:hypothetical protein